MSALGALASKLNRAGGVWQPNVRVWDGRFVGTSFDRLLYLFLHKIGRMGRAEHALMAQHVAPGMTAVDIGANIGLYTCRLSRLVGDAGRVFAFEPEPALFACLQRNCDVNGRRNVVLHNVAVGAATGTATLTRSAVNSGDNRVRGGEAGAGDIVKIMTVDDALGDARPDFIKMDVQGYEMQALRGMNRTLARSGRLVIFLEFWPGGLRDVGDDPAALLDLLAAQSFTLHSFHDGAAHPIRDLAAFSQQFQGTAYGHVLAVRS